MAIRKVFEEMSPGTQVLFLAESVEGFNDHELSLETVSLVCKKETVAGVIVRKGEWPFVWESAVVGRAEHTRGGGLFCTRGTRTTTSFFKSCMFNLRRKGHRPAQKTWQVIENVNPEENEGRLHKVYSAIEVFI